MITYQDVESEGWELTENSEETQGVINRASSYKIYKKVKRAPETSMDGFNYEWLLSIGDSTYGNSPIQIALHQTGGFFGRSVMKTIFHGIIDNVEDLRTLERILKINK